jgi:two-component system NtrC family response regulator
MSLVSAMGEAMLLPQHLPLDLRVRLMRGRVASRGLSPVEGGQERAAGTLGTWREHRARLLDRAEAEYFSALMDRAGGDAALAAELSGLKSARLYELLGKHGLVKGRRGPA